MVSYLLRISIISIVQHTETPSLFHVIKGNLARNAARNGEKLDISSVNFGGFSKFLDSCTSVDPDIFTGATACRIISTADFAAVPEGGGDAATGMSKPATTFAHGLRPIAETTRRSTIRNEP